MRKIFSFMVVAAIAAIPAKSFAVDSNTGSTACAVKIITPITINKTSDLEFGNISVLAGAAGTCVLSTSAVATGALGVNVASGTTPTVSTYSVSGLANAGYAVTLDASVTVKTSDNANSMTIDHFKAKLKNSASDQNQGSISGTLDTNGADEIKIGGQLNVGAAQAAGSYTGTLTVSVAYN